MKNTPPEVRVGNIRLTLACWNYDRTNALADGRVRVNGVDLNYLSLPVEETFFRMLRYREFDAGEMSLSSYVMSLFSDDPPFIAIPVFPSRSFRHSCIFVNRNSGIREPKDLIGKKVGSPEYQLTAPVWIRGILSDEYGVPVNGVSYFTGGQEEAGRIEKVKIALPADIRVQRIPPGKTLAQMLDAGEIDALYTPRIPSTFGDGSGNVRRLFSNHGDVEKAYFRKTRIFPIMHTLVIRRDIYRQHPWMAQSLYKAFIEAQRLAYADLYEAAALKHMLPWLLTHVEETREIMGQNFWPYGYEPNVKTLETFLRYSHEQGLSRRRLDPRDLFAPETFGSFKV
jgi:4,5-dihydroxyphthalate decarboxylase